MAGRQVRLDPDVVPAVEGYAKEHEGMSLSRAANDMLRAATAPPTARAAPETRTIVDSSQRRTERCKHPILRRVGNSCLACGADV